VTPSAARGALDRQLAQHGEVCTLRRIVGGVARDVVLRASIQDYRPTELIGGNGLEAGDSHVIISASEINAAQWPNAALLATTTAGDPRVAVKGDKFITSNGRVRVVLNAWAAPYIGGELVRVEMNIR
jgi:hypothetical protein